MSKTRQAGAQMSSVTLDRGIWPPQPLGAEGNCSVSFLCALGAETHVPKPRVSYLRTNV